MLRYDDLFRDELIRVPGVRDFVSHDRFVDPDDAGRSGLHKADLASGLFGPWRHLTSQIPLKS